MGSQLGDADGHGTMDFSQNPERRVQFQSMTGHLHVKSHPDCGRFKSLQKKKLELSFGPVHAKLHSK